MVACVQTAVASMMLIAEAVGMMRFVEKPADISRFRYSASVRSRPPA